jgi:hypothetical protein
MVTISFSQSGVIYKLADSSPLDGKISCQQSYLWLSYELLRLIMMTTLQAHVFWMASAYHWYIFQGQVNWHFLLDSSIAIEDLQPGRSSLSGKSNNGLKCRLR